MCLFCNFNVGWLVIRHSLCLACWVLCPLLLQQQSYYPWHHDSSSPTGSGWFGSQVKQGAAVMSEAFFSCETLLPGIIKWRVLSCDIASESLPWHMSCCIRDCKHLSYPMTLDKPNHPYPWYAVSSCLQDLRVVTGLQMPLQLASISIFLSTEKHFCKAATCSCWKKKIKMKL